MFTSVVTIFTSVVNLRYEFAIPLAKDDKEAVTITLLSGIVAILFSLVLFLVFLLFQYEILNLVGGTKIGNLLFLVPLTVFLNGIFNCLNYFSIRFKKYRVIASSNIIRASSNAGLQLGMGIFGLKYGGLIAGYVISFLFGNARMLKNFFEYRSLILKVSKMDLKASAKRFKRFPLISVWGMFLNNVSLNLNSFFIARFFGAGQLGFYSYSYRYINAPLSLISSNMGQLFYQVCTECYLKGKPANKEFLATLKRLILICAPIFIVLYFIIEDAFLLFFGPKWQFAGLYCKILIPLFFVRTVYGPLSLITPAFEKQQLSVLLQVIIFLVNVVVILIAYWSNFTMIKFLQIYSVSGCISYIILLVINYRISKLRFNKTDN
ncbi:colanic acid exporter [compost metagenome]